MATSFHVMSTIKASKKERKKETEMINVHKLVLVGWVGGWWYHAHANHSWEHAPIFLLSFSVFVDIGHRLFYLFILTKD